MSQLPEDPPGYRITLDGDGRWVLVRLADDVELGRYPDKQAAVNVVEH